MKEEKSLLSQIADFNSIERDLVREQYEKVGNATEM